MAQSTREPSISSRTADVQPVPSRDVVRTVCGREFTIGELRLEHVAHPAARVSLSTHPLPQDAETLWASLTPDEARRLAAHLWSHAAAADAGEPAPARSVEASYVDARRYVARLGNRNRILAELDAPDGNDAAADLFAASVALELARRAERFLARHELRRDGLRVSAHYPPGHEKRAFTVAVVTPPSLSQERKNALRTLLVRSILRDPAYRRARIDVTVT